MKVHLNYTILLQVTVCSLLYKYADAAETGHNFGSTILKALVKPLLEKGNSE